MSEPIRLRPGDRVRHKDGREGMVERVQPGTVSVQFPYHWRTSVVRVENISPIERENEAGA